MAITRDPSFPAEAALLVQAFNACADGHDAKHVLDASLHMTATAIKYYVKEHGGGLGMALDYAEHIFDGIRQSVNENWDREPQPTDVPVRANG